MHTKAVKKHAIEVYEAGFSCRATAKRIARELGIVVAPQTVARWARELGINRPVGEPRTVELPKDAIRLYESGKTISELANVFRVSETTVGERLRGLGVSIRPSGLRYTRLADRKWLENQYWELGRSAEEIAKEIGCSVMSVHYHLRTHGIPRKRERERQQVRRQVHSS